MKLILRRAALAVCAFLVVPTVGVAHTGIDPGQTRVIKGLLGDLAPPHHPPGSPAVDDPERLTGVLRSLLIRR